MGDGWFDGSFFGFLLYTLWIFILISFIFVVIRIIMDVFRSSDIGGVGKFFWILFIIVLPVLGALIYLFARGSGMAQRDMDDMKRAREYDKEYTRSLINESGAGGSAGEIERAKSLLDSGAITQAEFETLKAKALS
jgi:hypothetical protein